MVALEKIMKIRALSLRQILRPSIMEDCLKDLSVFELYSFRKPYLKIIFDPEAFSLSF